MIKNIDCYMDILANGKGTELVVKHLRTLPQKSRYHDRLINAEKMICHMISDVAEDLEIDEYDFYNNVLLITLDLRKAED